MGFNFTYFFDSLRSGIEYLPNTFQLTFIPIVIALFLGMVIILIRALILELII